MDKTFDSTKPLTKLLEVATYAVQPTEAQLEAIQAYLLPGFPLDKLYIREMELANNQVDRSHERFDSGYLRRFAETLPGKSVLVGHDDGSAPIGRFFQAKVGKGSNGWQWVKAAFYMPVSNGNELARDSIDSGVWSHVSIGCLIDWNGLMCDICGQPYYPSAGRDNNCPHLAGEEYEGEVCTVTYSAKHSDMNKVEAVEGSIVYLGCQYDAAIKKTAGEAEDRRLYKATLLGAEIITKPYPNEHACRLRDPGDFQDGSFRRTSREHDGKTYYVIMGRLEGEDTMTEQAYRYPKDSWEPVEARSHCAAHHGNFEAASTEETCETCNRAFDYNLPPVAAEKEDVNVDELEKLRLELEAANTKIADLESEITRLAAMADEATKLKTALLDEIKRLAACVGDELIPTVVDKITDIDELTALRTKLEAKWSDMRGVTAQSEQEKQPQATTTRQSASFGAF